MNDELADHQEYSKSLLDLADRLDDETMVANARGYYTLGHVFVSAARTARETAQTLREAYENG